MFKRPKFKDVFSRQPRGQVPDSKPAAAQAIDSGHAAASGSAGCAPGSEIRYHADLIGRLHAQHVGLQELCAAVREHALNDRFAEAQKALESFRRALMAHLLEENVKLYTYLWKCVEEDADRREGFLSMKGEMRRIGTRVLGFFQTYAGTGVTRRNKSRFLMELAEIRAALAGRIEQEETSLFGMYAPPEAFIRGAPGTARATPNG